MITKLSFL